MKILFTGGGTGGPVMPLLATYQKLSKDQNSKEMSFFWLGGKEGIEKNIIKNYPEIKYFGISAGKFRRYFSWQNFLDIFRILIGFLQSLKILSSIKPDVIVTVGSFISVPVVWAGAMLRIPIIVHQQDIVPGLANKLMAPFAKKITVSFEKSLADYSAQKTEYIGNPVREEVLASNNEEMLKKYQLEKIPTILILGGGTGAVAINKAVVENLKELVNLANIFHSCGKGKVTNISEFSQEKNIKRYHQFEFGGEDFLAIVNKADIIITRAGLSSLSEFAVLGKPTIVIPMPDSHQEKNAEYFEQNKAIIYLKEQDLANGGLSNLLKSLINDKNKLAELSENIKKLMPADASEKLAEIIMSL
jgi:UDP-N-acetylglucosamine--N-acetylmuramyl-(pentapeptide) pyrophosphoryl-undecaprenol N-acetylglucosamine transferase